MTAGRYLLDTNTVSYLFRSQGKVAERLAAVPVGSVSISAITEAELRYGLARRPSEKLAKAVDEFLLRVVVLPWTSSTAKSYGKLRAVLEKDGLTVALHDLLIAAHAHQVGATLVSHDHVFTHFPGLDAVDWFA
jgi:tRNA(fMet)-specific endonuclease VapC